MHRIGTFGAVMLALAILSLPSAGARAAEGAPVPGSRPISAEEMRARAERGERILIVDVRDELERGVDGHIPGDISVPLHPEQRFAATIVQVVPDRGAEVVLYCKGGIPSGLSAQANGIMTRLGYTNVSYISGGFDHWPFAKVRG